MDRVVAGLRPIGPRLDKDLIYAKGLIVHTTI